MKTIVLSFSRQFPKYHPKAGKETKFVENILEDIKLTTIRGNYNRWLDIADKLDAGTHFLSLRYWSNKPYRSKQVEFEKVFKIDLKEVFITNGINGFQITINDEYLYYNDQVALAKKEGFEELEDFKNYFKEESFSGVMIEFLKVTSVF
ncbi:hypothetical protein QWY81_17805 [Polaribacter undariae]|uniref:Uncharacterized protein n=1 Tax=Polaribacter sejongensis TaxID=985043 RepID=A0AAJ1VKK2_9FLAO|nr:hypothetical protein [Polaribacter undariae]MDN3621327.1 hypothetical protein [Polaribacter undariae]UWD31869.1 hypothetical protein NQP51_17270 [Polaribacter undariae]